MSDLMLLITLIFLVLIACFFSLSETSMMSLNRYRLRHLARGKQRNAKRVLTLLDSPDRLLGLILIGNTFANILAGSVFTMLAIRLWGEHSVALATLGLTMVILVIGEIAPKTVAVIYPLNIALAVSWPIKVLLWVFYPIVWFMNMVSNGVLRLLGVKLKKGTSETLSHDELRSIVHEAGVILPSIHKNMLLSLLDLEKLSVDDIMVPKNEIDGIDLSLGMEDILYKITHSKHVYLPVYREEIDSIEGMLKMRDVFPRLADKTLTKENILQICKEVYFIPSGTPLNTQLLNFRHEQQRCGLVVDEYGDIEGFLSVEDILEEVVGEFSATNLVEEPINALQKDGSYIVDARVSIRDLNRKNNWHLPVAGPKTLNGLILEYLEYLPSPGICFRLEGYFIEILSVDENRVGQVKVSQNS